MKQIKLSELKVGDKLTNTISKFGNMVNRVVVKIETTKSGRIKMEYTYDYIAVDGNDRKNLLLNYSNGALSPNALITLL